MPRSWIARTATLALVAGTCINANLAHAQDRDYEYSVEYGFYDDELEYEEPQHEYFSRDRELARERYRRDDRARNQYFDEAGEYEYFDDDYRDDVIGEELEDEDYYREGWYESYYGRDSDEAEWFEGDEDSPYYYDNYYGSYYSDESNSDWWD